MLKLQNLKDDKSFSGLADWQDLAGWQSEKDSFSLKKKKPC
jgi:hypothetical protein